MVIFFVIFLTKDVLSLCIFQFLARRARQFYSPRVQTVCDICEGDVGCEVCGRGSAGSRRNGADSYSASNALEASVATLVMASAAFWLARI
jgi:hypothetical protein